MKALIASGVMLLAIIKLSISCQKETLNSLSPNKLGKRTDLHPDTLYEIMLNTFARGLIISSRDSNFRNDIHDMAGEEFTDDIEVLGYTLDQEYSNFKNTLKTSIDSVNTSYSSGLSDEFRLSSERYANDLGTIALALEGFEYESFKFFPQIFIPFYDSVNLHQDPVIAVATEDSTIIWGYQKDQYTDNYNVIEINETFAKNNLVWVISVNEVLDNQNDLDSLLVGGGGFDSLGKRSPNCAFYKLTELKISKHLEKWHGGRNDIAILGIHVNESTGAISGKPFFDGKMIKIKKKNLDVWHTIPEEDGWLVTDGDLLCAGESVDFIIYEKDANRNKYRRVVSLWYGGECTNDAPDVAIWSRQNEFFVRSYPYCSRRYSELGSSPWALDLHYNHSGYNGEAKFFYGKY